MEPIVEKEKYDLINKYLLMYYITKEEIHGHKPEYVRLCEEGILPLTVLSQISFDKAGLNVLEEKKPKKELGENRPNIRLDEVESYVRDILAEIDSKCGTNSLEAFNSVYPDIFDFEEYDNVMDPLYDTEINTSSYRHDREDYYVTDFDGEYNTFHYHPATDQIKIVLRHNYTDVLRIIHEFTHFTNNGPRYSESRGVLTEAMSIYFEMYAENYLLKNGIADKTNINILERFDGTLDLLKDMEKYAKEIALFAEKGKLSDESYEYFQRTIHMSEEKYKTEINNLYQMLKGLENKYKKEHEVDSSVNVERKIYFALEKQERLLRYVLGTLITTYMLNPDENNNIDEVNLQKMAYLNLELRKDYDLGYYFEILGINPQEIRDEFFLDGVPRTEVINIANRFSNTYELFKGYEEEKENKR